MFPNTIHHFSIKHQLYFSKNIIYMNTTNSTYSFGMIGLGTMGRNLLLNMADHGFSVTGHDKSEKMLALLGEEGKKHNLKGFAKVEDFINSLR